MTASSTRTEEPAPQRGGRIVWNGQPRPGRRPQEIADEARQPGTTFARIRQLYQEMGGFKAALVTDEQGHSWTIQSLLLHLGHQAKAREEATPSTAHIADGPRPGSCVEPSTSPGLTRHPFRGQVSPDPEDTRWKEHR